MPLCPSKAKGFLMHCCIICDCCIIYGLLLNSPRIIYGTNVLTVINGLTCYNEIIVHQAYLLFRLLLLKQMRGQSVGDGCCCYDEWNIEHWYKCFFLQSWNIFVSLLNMFKAHCCAGLYWIKVKGRELRLKRFLADNIFACIYVTMQWMNLGSIEICVSSSTKKNMCSQNN